MTTTIAVACHAGGVGKTTTTDYLSYMLAKSKKVLAIDLDPQASLSARYRMQGPYIEDALAGRSGLRKVAQSASRDDGPYFLCAPASLRLQETAAWLQSQPVTHDHLEQLLRDAEGLVDVVLIDCPPSADLLTVNALVAADYVIVPVIPEPKGLDGLDRMVELVEWINSRRLSQAQIMGSVVTQIDWRTNLHANHVELLRNHPAEVLAEITMARGMDAGTRLAQMYQPLAQLVLDLIYVPSDHVEYAPC